MTVRDSWGSRIPRRAARAGLAAGLLLLCVGLAPAGAEDAPEAEASAARPAPTLDQLLRLPSGVDTGIERRGGLTRGEWHARFERIDTDLAREKKALETAQAERDRVAGTADAWLLGPPGTTSTDAPLDYRLRQEINRHKEEIERLERARKDLEVEANLAGVPDDWRL
jgi:hypothetical protein